MEAPSPASILPQCATPLILLVLFPPQAAVAKAEEEEDEELPAKAPITPATPAAAIVTPPVSAPLPPSGPYTPPADPAKNPTQNQRLIMHASHPSCLHPTQELVVAAKSIDGLLADVAKAAERSKQEEAAEESKGAKTAADKPAEAAKPQVRSPRDQGDGAWVGGREGEALLCSVSHRVNAY